MIAFLRGRVVSKAAQYVTIEVNNIGYRVFVPQRLLGRLDIDTETLLHTYMQVREDDISLYGFTEPETLTLFETLLTVSGVGPKLALSIINAVSADDFYRAIINNELSVLTKIPGIGKKTAQRLVLELKDKLAAQADAFPFATDDAPTATGGVQEQVVEALTALGYRADEAAGALRAAMRQAPDLTLNEAQLLREALKYLGSRNR
ncbi:MAG: Holliday junction branch migration protein RuvA [Firmicutes bacterium]|nr:Holliday junction branch migration protein RuvA [Bacillota bacterium]